MTATLEVGTQPAEVQVRERRSTLLVSLTVLVLHALGWGTLLLFVMPADLSLGVQADGTTAMFTGALGVTAFLLGVRHAFDADHIAAIDNTTRRLLAEGRPASTVGFWFSMGHSTVVVGLCLLLAFGLSALMGPVADEGSAWHQFTGVWGPLVAGLFLLAIAALNIVTLRRILASRGARTGSSSDSVADPGAEGHVAGGPVTRLLDRIGARIRTPRQMYVVGLLFGFGFDTATEISLLLLAGTAGLAAVPWWAVLTLPLLFTAGMSTFDLAQGWVARRAYGWADSDPKRLLTYNIGITTVSVMVALVVGAASLSGALAQWFGVPDVFAWTDSVGLEAWGFALAGVLLVAWIGVVVMRALTRSTRRPA
ncbi:HoxN/HupN/NixA family nickel/cobalt transporter [Kocuria sp.]|uniref:HoxN/HupN/NixA family nickel/cobalt transporter n=1 Tax=Kocuria sp. TaxID=1871328 RepID=UPI0026DECD06|nr:HoxN/HupN/NixA family nickel/cobalt transporter [Kocuria sp.]MDO5618907.1 HoxN/HupN/NixA family nickel/cobalt transporter [Kocuria sp.]